jgi:hypothetical protein
MIFSNQNIESKKTINPADLQRSIDLIIIEQGLQIWHLAVGVAEK